MGSYSESKRHCVAALRWTSSNAISNAMVLHSYREWRAIRIGGPLMRTKLARFVSMRRACADGVESVC